MRVGGGAAAYVAGDPAPSGAISPWKAVEAEAAAEEAPSSRDLFAQPVPLIALRVSGKSFVFEGVNAAFEAATGLAAGAVIGTSIEAALPSCGDMVSLCRQCVQSLASVSVVAPAPGKPQDRYFRMTAVPVREISGEAVLILIYAYPVSEVEIAYTAGEITEHDRRDELAAPVIQFTAFESGWPDRIGANFFSYSGLPFDAPPERLIGAMHPEDRARVSAEMQSSRGGSICVDARIRRGDGAWRWFRFRAERVDGYSGRRWYGVGAEYGGDAGLRHVARPSETRSGATATQVVAPGPDECWPRHEAAVRLSNLASATLPGQAFALAEGGSVDLLEGICAAVAADVALLDADARIQWANAPCRDSMAELEPIVGIGSPYIDLCRELIDDLDERTLERGLEAVAQGREPSFTHVYLDSRTSALRWRQLRVTRLTIGDTVRLVALHEDLTEASDAQAALCNIGEQLLSAQERERQRIAVELHDSTSQHLVALGLGITRLRRVLGQGDQTRDVLDDMTKSLQEAVKEVRVLSYLMKPPGLERDGLQATLEAFVRGFGARSSMRIGFRTDGRVDDVDLEVSHAVYRVVQEALSNVYRHAEAKSVDIWLVRRANTLRLRIADDGHGMARSSHGEGEEVLLGVGIPGMRTRIAQLGGRLTIRSDASGTVVTAVTPVEAKTSAAEPRSAPMRSRSVEIPPARVN